MKYQILVATALAEPALSFIQSAPRAEVKVIAPDVAALRKAIPICDAVIIRDDVPIDADLLEAGKRLKVIGRAGVSLAGIDVEAATTRGVIVMNTPGASAISTAEYTFALMLALTRQVIDAHLGMQKGAWSRESKGFGELSGKTLGIIGLGRVGRKVAERAIAFGMEVIALDPYVSETQIGDLKVKLLGLDEVLQRADILSIHCAVTPETYHLIDAEALAMLKPGARIVNLAHGDIVDEAALAVVLKAGRVAGAAIDVFSHEPPITSPLIGLPNVIYTPHMGDATPEAQNAISMMITRQVYDALLGTDYRNAVNLPFMPGKTFETMAPYLTLAERIGSLQHFLSRGRIRRVAVEYKGEELDGMVKPLTVALLKGMLSPILGDSVNYINAPLVAMERGIHVTQTKGLDVADYTNLVSCQVHWEGGGQQVISGALFNRREPRIVQIDTYRTDFVPSGTLLVFGSYDVPGVIGKVGTLMSQHKINIAAWRTGREVKGGQTLTVLTLDQQLPESLLDEFRKLEIVRMATQVVLP